MVYLLPLLSMVMGLIVSYRFVMVRRGNLVAVLAAICVAVSVWAILQGRAQANGWDAIGYAILVFLALGPVLIGLGAGTLLGLYRRRAAVQKTGHDHQDPDPE